MQTRDWQPPAEPSLDPIIRQDSNGNIWFDDITVYRLPRVRLGLSNAGEPGVARPEATDVVLDVPQLVAVAAVGAPEHHGRRAPRSATVRTTRLLRTRRRLAARPPAAVGAGPVHVLSRAVRRPANHTCTDRFGLRFCQKLPATSGAIVDFGVDLGALAGLRATPRESRSWRRNCAAGPSRWACRCSRSRIGGTLPSYVDEIGDLARALIAHRIVTIGTFLPPTASRQDRPAVTARAR